VSVRGLAERVAQLVDPGLAIEHIPYAKAYAPGFEDIRARVPDLTRIKQLIGYEPRYRLEHVLNEILEWKQGVAGSQ
jgi:UDP-glucose 4-epimerase